MNEFDQRAASWDENPMHWDRSKAIAEEILKTTPLTKSMNALEFGAGTGILSFMLKDHLNEITLMDNSIEMLKMTDAKIEKSKVSNLKTIHFDLEQREYKENKFDFIFTQMVLHHVQDIKGIISRFNGLLNRKGYIAIADLYTEDGSFHDAGFNGHKGFDVEQLSKLLSDNGFENIKHKQCFVINRALPDGSSKQFPIFLLTANKV